MVEISKPPEVVFAPSVSDRDRRLIARLGPFDWAAVEAEHFQAAQRRRKRTMQVLAGIAVAIVVGLIVDPITTGLFLVMVSVFAVVAGTVINAGGIDRYHSHQVPDRRGQAAAHRQRGQYVRLDSLASEAAIVLRRMLAATAQIAAAPVAARELDDTASPEALAVQTWQASQSLAEYTRLRRATPRNAPPGAAREEATAQHALLDETLASMKDRVTELEALAREITAADKELRARQARDEQAAAAAALLESNRNSVLDLAAGTARDSLATADVRRQLQRLAERTGNETI